VPHKKYLPSRELVFSAAGNRRHASLNSFQFPSFQNQCIFNIGISKGQDGQPEHTVISNLMVIMVNSPIPPVSSSVINYYYYYYALTPKSRI